METFEGSNSELTHTSVKMLLNLIPVAGGSVLVRDINRLL